MNANPAANGLVLPLHFKYMKELITGRSPTHVSNVVKHSPVSVPFENMNEPTLGKSPIRVNSVGSGSVLPVLFKYTNEFTVEKSPNSVVGPSVGHFHSEM